MREFTIRAIAVGVLVGIVFGAANAYLGLKVGMTVSASIPAAVMAVAVFRTLWRGSILECNMVQTIGSAGESLAAGVIFTVPAMFMLGHSPSLLRIFLLSAFGGVLGVLFMVPLRRVLIVKEHGVLPYPEGTACAEVLKAGEAGGRGARIVFSGAGIGAVYKLLMSGFGLWNEQVSWQLPRLRGAVVGMDVLPSLLGVGYIIGPRIAAVMFAGGALSWLVFIPVIAYMGQSASEAIAPAAKLISEMSPGDIWHNYIRYIGAGGVALGGLVSLARALPTVIRSASMGLRDAEAGEKELPAGIVLAGAVATALLAWLLTPIPLAGAALVLVFAFFFVGVSSRVVGLIGSSSNPASGMTIATLLATSVILYALGNRGPSGTIAAITVGSIVCIAICVAGDTSQDLKTGFLVSATPRHQQVGELIGVLTSALFVGLTLFLLDAAYGLGPDGELKAPQATLMSFVVRGVFEGELPWNLVFIGMFAAGVVELCGVPALPFAVGLYLPMSLTAPIMVGGLGRLGVDKARSGEPQLRPGVLYSSGLIAGEAICAIVLAVFAWRKIEFAFGTGWMGGLAPLGTFLIFVVLTITLWRVATASKTD